MTSNRALGWTPFSKNVNLVPDTDFVDSILPPTGETWPVGLEVKIVFNDTDATEFVATVTPDLIAWNIDEAVVNTLIAAAPTKVKVTYKDGAAEFTWMQGRPVIAAAS